ncbi:hypothetical protein LCGC14_2876480, partial [marine sediment metagenome]
DTDGEGFYLFDTVANSQTLLDSIEFGRQIPDLSIGRIGHDAAWALTQPTFGQANTAQRTGDPAKLKINEWLADGRMFLADDFIELYNPDPLPVPLGGMFITDDPVGQPDKHMIPPLSFVGSTGYAVFVPDDNADNAGSHLAFKLSVDQELIGLYDTQLREIDKIIYYSQTTDISQGRSPDGERDFEFFTLPTPGVANLPMPGLIDLLDGLRVSELMYHPAGDEELEFVELINVGAGTLDLTGVRLTDAVGFTFPAMMLPPGQRVVVVRDLRSFYSYYGSGINVAGQYSGNLSDGGEDFVVQLPDPLDAAIQRFDFDDDWYPTTDGGGFALSIIDPTADLTAWDEAASWQVGPVGGSPGHSDIEPPVNGVVISEVLSHTDAPSVDAIELYNP